MKTSHDDVDTLIDFATERMPVFEIAADTDVLIMLLYFWNNEMANILMLSDSAQSKEKSLKFTILRKLQRNLTTRF